MTMGTLKTTLRLNVPVLEGPPSFCVGHLLVLLNCICRLKDLTFKGVVGIFRAPASTMEELACYRRSFGAEDMGNFHNHGSFGEP